MGSSGAETPTEASKSSAAQERPPVPAATGAAVYPDWSGFQAYSPIPPHGFFPSPMASSPQCHPYVWGQHMMPPYGTSPHPYVMYPHGGMYAHPSMHPGAHPFNPYPMLSSNSNAETPSAAPGGEEWEGKSSNGKDKPPLKASKRSLGSLNMITGKTNSKPGKSLGASNGAASHSGEIGSDDSSEGSDANSQKESQVKTGNTQGSNEDEVTPNGSAGAQSPQNGVTHMTSQAILNQGMAIMPMQVTGDPAGVSGPTTNLNIGMDYWGATTPPPIVPMRGKVSNPPVVSGLGPSRIGGRENIPSDLWLQDERELKRQRRKQSNRESARRSRLRKQAECEELGHRVDVLKEENSTLRAELNRFRKEYQQLLSENTSLKESLDEAPKNNATILDNMSNLHSDECEKNLDSGVQEGPEDNVQRNSLELTTSATRT